MIDKIKKLFASEAFRYLVIGGCTTGVNLVIFAALCYLTPMKEMKNGVNLANIISIVSAIIFAYIANKLVVFQSHTGSVGALLLEIGKFMGGRALTMVLEVGGVWLGVSILDWNEMLSKLLTQVLVIIGNYFLSKYVIFRN